MRLQVEHCKKVIVACAVLHNMAIDQREPTPAGDDGLQRAIDT